MNTHLPPSVRPRSAAHAGPRPHVVHAGPGCWGRPAAGSCNRSGVLQAKATAASRFPPYFDEPNSRLFSRLIFLFSRLRFYLMYYI